MAHVATLVGQDFEDPEFFEPRDAMLNAGHELDVIGQKAGKELTGKRGGTVTTSRSIDDVEPGDYDALVIPGGYSPDHLRLNEDMVDFTRSMVERGVPVAVICHGPWMLIEAGVTDGRKLTSWPSLRTDLINSGADWVDEELVTDGNLITSRNPDDLPAFCDALLSALEGQ